MYPINPLASDLARFLADLHLINRLSYNSILLHKSVVSTLGNPDSSGHLGSHVLVKLIFKAINYRNLCLQIFLFGLSAA